MQKYKVRVYLLILLISFAVIASVYTSNIVAKNDDNEGDFEAKGKKSGIILNVEPPVRSIPPGGVTQYSIEVESIGPPNGLPYVAIGVIHLAIRGLPKNTIGIFTPSMGLSSFKSKLTVIAGDNVKPGLYELTIFAFNKKRNILEATKVALAIEGAVSVETTSTTTSSETTTTSTGLRIDFSTDKLSYSPGEQVILEGIVTDQSHNSIVGASVSIQVDNPSGSAIHVYQTTTDEQGFFNDTFTLPGDAPNGVYTVFISATYQGYYGAEHSIFIVGENNEPMVSILSLNITASNGVQVAAFEPGTEAVASIQVLNQGMELENAIIWLEVGDPRDVPIYITLLSTRLGQDENITVQFHIFLEEDAVEGVYTANAYVSDDYISQGGTFLDKEQEIFIVAETSTTVTTTTTTTQEATNTTATNTTLTLTGTTTNSTTTTITTTPTTISASTTIVTTATNTTTTITTTTTANATTSETTAETGTTSETTSVTSSETTTE